MMLLRTQPKNKFSAIVEIDENIRGVLSNKALRSFSLAPQQETEIDPQLAEAIDIEISNAAWQKFLNWIAFQERAISQSRQYLLHLPLAPELAEPLVTKACQYNYLNDDRFTKLLIESLIDRSKSLPEIRNKLYEKKISPELILKYLTKLYDQDTQNQVIEKLVDQLFYRWLKLEPAKRKSKVCEYLTRRGFNYYSVNDYYQRIENAQENNC
jgi:regulatory protein